MADWDILSFSHRLDWSDGIAHTVKFLLPRFARERKVLNFNPLWEWRQAYRHPTRLYRIQENLWHFEWGRLFPFFRRPPAAVRTMAFVRSLAVRWLCSRVGIGEHIYLVWNPVQAPVVQWLPTRFTVYYAYDQFDQFYHEKPEWQEEILKHEGVIRNLVHIAFGVSIPLTESLRERGFRKACYSPNAVEWERFSLERGQVVPKDICHIPKPRLCYVGGLYQKTDFATLIFISKNLPRYSLVLIGNNGTMDACQRQRLDELLSLQNVFFLGARPYAEVVSYLGACDVGLAPFVTESDAYFCSPLKVYEYLAVGMPIVASPILEVKQIGDLVYSAYSPEEWVLQIERALREDSADLRRRRQEFAKQHSWDNRAKQVMEHIEQAYQEWKGVGS